MVNFLSRRAGDAETAQVMRVLAEAFRASSAMQGEPFGWDVHDVRRLDEHCERFLATDPSAGARHSMAMAMGAYLGELMVRHGKGRWVYGTGDRKAVVVLRNGLTRYPHDEVAARLEPGTAVDLHAYFRYAVAGPSDLRDALVG